MKQEPPESNETPQQSGQFDIASKQIVRQNPDECIQFYLGIPEVKHSGYLKPNSQSSNRTEQIISYMQM